MSLIGVGLGDRRLRGSRRRSWVPPVLPDRRGRGRNNKKWPRFLLADRTSGAQFYCGHVVRHGNFAVIYAFSRDRGGFAGIGAFWQPDQTTAPGPRPNLPSGCRRGGWRFMLRLPLTLWNSAATSGRHPPSPPRRCYMPTAHYPILLGSMDGDRLPKRGPWHWARWSRAGGGSWRWHGSRLTHVLFVCPGLPPKRPGRPSTTRSVGSSRAWAARDPGRRGCFGQALVHRNQGAGATEDEWPRIEGRSSGEPATRRPPGRGQGA